MTIRLETTPWPKIQHDEARRIYRYLYDETAARLPEIAAATQMDAGIVHSHLLHYEPDLWYRTSTRDENNLYHVRTPDEINNGLTVSLRITITDT